MTQTAPAAGAPARAPLEDLLASAAARAVGAPEYSPQEVLERAAAELATDEAKRLFARLLTLHGLLPEAEPGKQFLANVIAVASASGRQIRTRLEAMAAPPPAKDD